MSLLFCVATTEGPSTSATNATFSLLLPGKILYFNALNEQQKFRGRGNKDGAKKAWQHLEDAGLGTLIL